MTTKKTVSAWNAPITDQDLMTSTVQDITEQHNAVNLLKQNEEKFSNVAFIMAVTGCPPVADHTLSIPPSPNSQRIRYAYHFAINLMRSYKPIFRT
jgi:hypothetical protein